MPGTLRMAGRRGDDRTRRLRRCHSPCVTRTAGNQLVAVSRRIVIVLRRVAVSGREGTVSGRAGMVSRRARMVSDRYRYPVASNPD